MKTLMFLLGLLTGLAFNHIPRYAIFTDQPATPEGHKPKIRTWTNGEENDPH